MKKLGFIWTSCVAFFFGLGATAVAQNEDAAFDVIFPHAYVYRYYNDLGGGFGNWVTYPARSAFYNENPHFSFSLSDGQLGESEGDYQIDVTIRSQQVCKGEYYTVCTLKEQSQLASFTLPDNFKQKVEGCDDQNEGDTLYDVRFQLYKVRADGRRSFVSNIDRSVYMFSGEPKVEITQIFSEFGVPDAFDCLVEVKNGWPGFNYNNVWLQGTFKDQSSGRIYRDTLTIKGDYGGNYNLTSVNYVSRPLPVGTYTATISLLRVVDSATVGEWLGADGAVIATPARTVRIEGALPPAPALTLSSPQCDERSQEVIFYDEEVFASVEMEQDSAYGMEKGQYYVVVTVENPSARLGGMVTYFRDTVLTREKLRNYTLPQDWESRMVTEPLGVEDDDTEGDGNEGGIFSAKGDIYATSYSLCFDVYLMQEDGGLNLTRGENVPLFLFYRLTGTPSFTAEDTYVEEISIHNQWPVPAPVGVDNIDNGILGTNYGHSQLDITVRSGEAEKYRDTVDGTAYYMLLSGEQFGKGTYDITVKLLRVTREGVEPWRDAQGELLDDFSYKLVLGESGESAAVEPREMQGVKLYPNPTSGSFTLYVAETASVEIYSANGVQVQRRKVAAGTARFNISVAGTYFVKVTSAGKTFVRRVVVR